MQTNPFDDPEGVFHVLVDAAGQHSLWPVFHAPPAGWTPVLTGVGRRTALEWIDAHAPESPATAA